MVKLGHGQALIGGKSNGIYSTKIYFMFCSNRNFILSSLNREISFPRGWFEAIPIPDEISGCITGGNPDFKKNQKFIYVQPNICLTLK